MPLRGGPQMVEISRDGRRVYVTNSLYAAWDEVFYPDGVGAWMAKLDADISAGGLVPDTGFFPHGNDFRGLRVHQTRLAGRRRIQRLVLLHQLSLSVEPALTAISSAGTWCPFAQRICTVASAPQSVVGEPQRGAVRQMLSPPLEHRPDHRHEVDPGLGQHVLVAAALTGLAVGLAGQHPRVDQLGQPRRRRGLGDADAADRSRRTGWSRSRPPA